MKSMQGIEQAATMYANTRSPDGAGAIFNTTDGALSWTAISSVAGVLAEHVTLEVEGIDRMYLNVDIAGLQREQGVVGLFRFHRGHQFVRSALMDPISRTL